MTYSLTNMSSLGTVTEERHTKDAQLFQMPMPGNDSNQTFVIDVFGAIRTISIKGIYVGTDVTAVKVFIAQLIALITGVQIKRAYASDLFGSSIGIFVMMVDYNYDAGNPLSVSYSIQMIEAA